MYSWSCIASVSRELFSFSTAVYMVHIYGTSLTCRYSTYDTPWTVPPIWNNYLHSVHARCLCTTVYVHVHVLRSDLTYIPSARDLVQKGAKARCTKSMMSASQLERFHSSCEQTTTCWLLLCPQDSQLGAGWQNLIVSPSPSGAAYHPLSRRASLWLAVSSWTQDLWLSIDRCLCLSPEFL